VGIAKNLYVGVNANIAGTLSVTGSTTLTNPVINNIKMGYSTTATAAGTTTLTVSSNYRQFFTGSTTQTIVLPVTSTLVTGMAFEIENNSTGLLTVNSSGGNLVGTIPAGVCAHAVCIGTTLTTAADWDWDYISTNTITGTGANVLGTSPTITTPTISSLSSAAATALTLQSAGTTAVTIDTSQNVGIGTISPSSMSGTGLQVGASSIFENVASSQTLVGGNAYYTGSAWKAVRTQTGYAAMRQNAVGPGVTSFHQNSASYTAGDTLTNMDTTDVRMYIDASGVLAFNSGYGSAAAAYGCRAWVNFNGTGTVAIRASANVTSITDSGVGLYDVNFTTALTDANYAINATAYSTNSALYTVGGQVNGQAPTTAKFRIAVGAGASFGADTTAGYADLPYIFASVFR
jgi:hypothetical protein